MPDPSSELPSSASTAEVHPVPQASVSVIVPTRDRPESLRRCLAALAAQTIGELEVVVVDDGSRDGDSVGAAVASHSFARLVRQASSGPAAARNAGARQATTDVLLFTDDDCEPEPNWAERLFGAIRSGADAAAGRTLPRDPHSALAVASELIAAAPAYARASSAGDLAFAPSNNLGCRADVLARVPFDERYRAAAGEDRDWCERVRAQGYALRSEPDAVLHHCVESTLRTFLARQVRYGRGAFSFRRSDGQRQSLESPVFYLELLRRGFQRGFRTGMLVALAQGATALGFVLEGAGMRR